MGIGEYIMFYFIFLFVLSISEFSVVMGIVEYILFYFISLFVLSISEYDVF